MSDISNLIAGFTAYSLAFEKIKTLAIEYHEKHITPERFAERVYETVYHLNEQLTKVEKVITKSAHPSPENPDSV